MFCVQLLRLAHLCHSPRTLPVLTDPLKRRNNFCRVDAQCFRLQRMISHMKRAQILSEVPICPNSVHREACRGPVAQLIAGAPMTPSRPGRHPGRQVGWQHSHVETESASLALLPSCQRGYLVSRVSWWWACACWSPSQGVSSEADHSDRAIWQFKFDFQLLRWDCFLNHHVIQGVLTCRVANSCGLQDFCIIWFLIATAVATRHAHYAITMEFCGKLSSTCKLCLRDSPI